MNQCKIEGCLSTDLASRTNLCKKHHNEYTRQHYQNNKQYYRDKRKRQQEKLVQDVIQIKESSPCSDCKVNYPYYIMDFDHVDATTKIANVADLIRLGGKKKVFDEIAKCELVCANCHRERTHQRRKQ